MAAAATAAKALYLEMPLKDAGVLRLKDRAELAAWLNQELANWEWVTQPNRDHLGLVDDRRGDLRGKLTTALNLCIALSQGSPEGSEEQLHVHLQAYANSGLVSTSARTKYFSNLRDQAGDIVATAAVAQFLQSGWSKNPAPQQHRHEVFRGRVAAALFDAGLGKAVSASVAQATEAIVADFRTQLAREVEANNEALADLKHTHAEISAERTATNARVKDEWSAFMSKANEEFGAAKADLAATEKAYKEQMNLRSSVQYWTSKATEHEGRARTLKRWLIGFAIVAPMVWVGALLGIFALALLFVGPLQERATAPLFVLGGIGFAITTVVVWIGRVLVRLFMSERSHGIDARERATMAETYAALTHEGTITTAERVVVLNALFRSGGENTPDDAAPEMLASLARLIDPKKH